MNLKILLPLVVVLSGLPCEAGRTADDASPNAKVDPLGVKPLVEMATHYRLPLPPQQARLVLAHTGSRLMLGSRSTSRDPAVYSPAFLLEEKPDGSVVVLRGAETEILKQRREAEPLFRPFSTEKVMPKRGGYAVDFDRLSTFVCAVQVAAIGKEEDAQEIWQRFSAARRFDHFDSGEEVRQQLGNPKRPC
jgi:hypothetical protein